MNAAVDVDTPVPYQLTDDGWATAHLLEAAHSIIQTDDTARGGA